jgi:hypothetical protein
MKKLYTSRYRYLYDLAFDIIVEKIPFNKYEKFAERISSIVTQVLHEETSKKKETYI